MRERARTAACAAAVRRRGRACRRSERCAPQHAQSLHGDARQRAQCAAGASALLLMQRESSAAARRAARHSVREQRQCRAERYTMRLSSHVN